MDPAYLDSLGDALVAAGRRLASRGLIAAGEGNLSLRLPDGSLLITPSGLRKDELAASQLLVVGPDGTVAARTDGLRPSSDFPLHRAVYAARPDVTAYAHAHLRTAMALTLAGEVPDPAVLPETALLVPRLPLVPLATPGSAELAHALAAALTMPPDPLPGVALLEHHGAVAVGGTTRGENGHGVAALTKALATAVDRLELVDVLCSVWLDAALLRAARRSGSA